MYFTFWNFRHRLVRHYWYNDFGSKLRWLYNDVSSVGKEAVWSKNAEFLTGVVLNWSQRPVHHIPALRVRMATEQRSKGEGARRRASRARSPKAMNLADPSDTEEWAKSLQHTGTRTTDGSMHKHRSWWAWAHVSFDSLIQKTKRIQ